MEAAVPIMKPKIEIEKTVITSLSLNSKDYLIQIGKNKNKEILNISAKQNDYNSNYFYEISLSLDEITKLGKYFKICDDIEEVINCFKKIINSKENTDELKISEINEKNLKLILKTMLPTGKEEKIEIELNKTQKDKDQIINDLRELINYLKTIPGFSEAINNYYSQNKNSKNFIDSVIIKNEEQLKFLKQYIEKGKSNITMELLYRATKDGGSASIFHQKCDDISPTLTVIKTNTGKIFGGYTTQSWNGNGDYKKDSEAFCYDLCKAKIYRIKEGCNAIYCSKDSISNFAGKSWFFIYVGNNCLNSDSNSCPIKDSNYEGMEKDYEINDGSKNFKINELEVYKIKFL